MKATRHNGRSGENLHILDWALHVDESTPHIHERHVFDCENQYGEICPQQEKALEAMGIPLPDSGKKPGKNNNRKIVFDKICRDILLEICEKHKLQVDKDLVYGGREYLEKQDYILEKQKERLRETEAALNEATIRLSDVDALTGDAIDLTAKLFEINSKEAAEKLAYDFGIMHPGRGSPKDIKPKVHEDPERELQRWILKAMDTLIRYSWLIREWKQKYAPQRMDDEYHPLFTEPLQNGAMVEFLLDEIFTGGKGEDRAFYKTYGKEITKIERRLERYEHGSIGSDRSGPGQAHKEADW